MSPEEIAGRHIRLGRVINGTSFDSTNSEKEAAGKRAFGNMYAWLTLALHSLPAGIAPLESIGALAGILAPGLTHWVEVRGFQPLR